MSTVQAAKLGFKTVATSAEGAANGMTALYVPEGIPPPALIGALAERGIVIAGGLHKDIKVRSRAPRGCEEAGKRY